MFMKHTLAYLPMLALIVAVLQAPIDLEVQAEGTDFSGTVLMVDPVAGKLAVKKAGGGTRFTFVVNDKTQFEGATGSLKDLKTGDAVTVHYQVAGSQYLALKIASKK
jgi:hypothetical protein